MKKTKLLTSLAALALVLGLGACDELVEDDTDNPDERYGSSETSSDSEDSSESTSGEDTSKGPGIESGVAAYENNGMLYFSDGAITTSITSSYFTTVTNNVDEAASFKVIETDTQGAYNLVLDDGSEETHYLYIRHLADGSGMQGAGQISSSESWKDMYWNEEFNVWTDADGDHYLGYGRNGITGVELTEEGPSEDAPAVAIMDRPVITALSLSIDGEEETVTEGLTINIAVTYTPANIGAANLTWVSSDEETATVENGIVTGVKPGNVTISATTTNNITKSIDVEVVEKQGVIEEMSKTITCTTLMEEFNVSYDADIDTYTSTYDGFEVKWNHDLEHSSGGRYIRLKQASDNTAGNDAIYVYKCGFEITGINTGQLTKITIISTHSSSGTHASRGCKALELTNTDYEKGNQVTLSETSEIIEANMLEGYNTTKVSVENSSSGTNMAYIYSIQVDYTIEK